MLEAPGGTIAFEGLIAPRLGDRFKRVLDRVHREFNVGRGKKYASADQLPPSRQDAMVRQATCEACFLGYRTKLGGTIEVQGEECRDTTAGRIRLMAVPLINDAVNEAIAEETERAKVAHGEEEKAAKAAEKN